MICFIQIIIHIILIITIKEITIIILSNLFQIAKKKDTESPKSETIPFQDFKQPVQNTANTSQNCTTENTRSINILGISLEIDDLIIIGLIILLFLESDKNYALIIILGLILLNVNLSDILNIF